MTTVPLDRVEVRGYDVLSVMSKSVVRFSSCTPLENLESITS